MLGVQVGQRLAEDQRLVTGEIEARCGLYLAPVPGIGDPWIEYHHLGTEFLFSLPPPGAKKIVLSHPCVYNHNIMQKYSCQDWNAEKSTIMMSNSSDRISEMPTEILY